YALTGLKLKFESVYNKSTNTHVEYTEILSNFNKFDANIVIKNMKKIGFLPRYTKYLMQCVPVNGCYSINICPSMLMGKEGESFIHYMSGLLNKNQIIIEITENSKISFCDGLKHRIEQLHELGFKIAIDDFGVGNNNLELLKDLTIDYVKIDKKFILNILESKNDKQYFYHIVRLLASATDAKIIAEGVETQAHSNLLTDNDVYLQQGLSLIHI
ncbi:EAL domain-containing protein, partial [Vibrio coralliilyticus]|uniref:EAL domain-containing protein n=1 Tax=Vibrio coralliilyticus TaxID=190893 RepID=UPI00148E405C